MNSLHRTPRGFRNPWPGAEPKGLANLLRWFAERHTTRPPAPDPDPSVFPLQRPRLGRVPHEGELAATWLGHSAVLLEFPTCTVLTDPMLGEIAAPIPAARLKRWVPAPIPAEQLPPVDLVLLSHNHYDHLDAPTVRILAERQPETVWCVPLGLGKLLRRLGVERVEEFDWWEARRIGDALVTATPAQHFSARGVHDRNATLWCGFTVRIGQRAVYFAGDTAHHPEFRAIGERLGPFDLLLLPVGAYEPRWFMQVMHMNPEEALRAFAEISGSTSPAMLPIHWGTFKLTDEPMDEPPRVTRELWTGAGRPGELLWLLQHGETRLLPR
ncbi:MAG TPA: MBL fold metallo-hydrolase [Gemmatimonadales bacterium]|nr:MBL fold metallo-hydrolase [Gemmatimonadales bacterium]